MVGGDAARRAGGCGTGWDTNRRIVTINDATGAAVPFRLANLSRRAASRRSTPAGSRRHAHADGPGGAQLPARRQVERGHRHDELPHAVAHSRRHRLFGRGARWARRASRTTTPATRATRHFASRRRSRARRWCTSAANDGMLHAFDRLDDGQRRQGDLGVHSRRRSSAAAIRTTPAHTPSPDSSSGRSRYRRGGIPLFDHKFYVNATPRVWDIDFANTNTGTPPQVRQRLAHDTGRRTRRRRPRRLRARRHRRRVALTRHRSRHRRGRTGAVGVHRRQPRLRLRRADARQDVALRLGRAGRLRIQQSRTARASSTC